VVHFDMGLLENGFNHLNQVLGYSEGLRFVGVFIFVRQTLKKLKNNVYSI
jgi:hypothetical protein